MKRSHVITVVILLALLTGLGWFFWQKDMKPSMPDKMADAKGVIQDGSGKTVKYWYDPMVPNQKFDKPGKSPFMDMQLQAKYANEGDGKDGGVAISSQTAHNLGIRFAKVEIQSFGEALSAVGRIEPDERRFYVVQTRVPGFVERLSVRAVGDPVRKGQKLAEIYAPELLAAQQEYLALRTLNNIDGDGSLKQAGRNRLKLLGMSESEVAAIARTGKSSPRFGIYAPASGILTELGVREGGQLMAGTSLMQISDLSQVWLIAEVPERDAARLKPGMDAEVQLQSLPGEAFKGKVGYLYPMLNDTTRTLQVRIELPNSGNRLRPGMYANISFAGQTHEALSVPTESVIATGKRKIVIVKEVHGYRPAEIETGQERDSYTEILKGLSEGEEVVASGQFLIDSEASLSGVMARLSQQQDAGQDMAGMKKPEPQKMPQGHGKVVDVSPESGKVTLAHEPISELSWPAMTMGFKVKDARQLSQLKPGDEVRFDLKTAPNSDQYMIDRIDKQDGMKGNKP